MRILALSLLTLGAGCGGAVAADVNFTGTVTSICSILAATDGLLALNTEGDVLSSEGTLGGLPGTVTILAIGSNTINVSAPQRTSAPPSGYDTTNEVVEVSYFGVDGLSLVSHSYTDQASSFTPGSISASVLTVNNRIRNPEGFVAGTYATQTEVTCAP